jgi:hypothetical protein
MRNDWDLCVENREDERGCVGIGRVLFDTETGVVIWDNGSDDGQRHNVEQ